MEITCKDIIEAMPGRFQKEGAGGWRAAVQFRFSGTRGGDFLLSVADGACNVSAGVGEKPTATVQTTDEVWIQMCLGKLDPQTAFMTGQIQVSGNMADIMQINNPRIFRRERPAGAQ